MSNITRDNQFDEMFERLRVQDYARYLAVKMAPASLHARLLAIHIVYQELADIARVAQEPMMGQVRLLWWRDSLTQLMQGQITGNPFADTLKEPLERFGPPLQQALLAVIEGVALELEEGLETSDQLMDMFAKRYGGLLRALLIVVDAKDRVPVETILAYAAAAGMGDLAAGVLRSSVSQVPLYPLDLLSKYDLVEGDFFEPEKGVKFGALFDELEHSAELDPPSIAAIIKGFKAPQRQQLFLWPLAARLFHKAKTARLKGSTEIIRLNPLAIYWHVMRALH